MRDPDCGGDPANNLHYDLSASDVIVAVSAGWDRAARTQGAQRCLADQTLGRSLWHSVNGAETVSYLNALLFSCRRSRKSIRSSYRCDNATEARSFVMTLIPLDGGHVRVAHTVQWAMPLLPLQPVQGHETARCSVCFSARSGDLHGGVALPGDIWDGDLQGGAWIDPMQPPAARPVPDRYVVCAHCKRAALAAIALGQGQRSAVQRIGFHV